MTWLQLLSVIGLGSIVAALLSIVWNEMNARRKRKGSARLIHEDLYRMQVTMVRMLAEPNPHSWQTNWALGSIATPEDHRSVLGALRGARLTALSSAVGWEEATRAAAADICSFRSIERNDLAERYEKLSQGRWVLSWWMGGSYRALIPENVVGHTPAQRIPEIVAIQAGDMVARRSCVDDSTRDGILNALGFQLSRLWGIGCGRPPKRIR